MHQPERTTLATEGGPGQQPAPPPQRRLWSLLVLLSVAEFMVILDATVVNVALPSIGRALHFAAGDRHGFTVAAGVAAGLALVALLAVPAVQPAPGTRVAAH